MKGSVQGFYMGLVVSKTLGPSGLQIWVQGLGFRSGGL